MGRVDDGGSAFPNKVVLKQGTVSGEDGMTLRDWFAGQALIAIASRWQGTIGDIDDEAQDRSASIAYEIADAMLKMRKVSPHGQ